MQILQPVLGHDTRKPHKWVFMVKYVALSPYEGNRVAPKRLFLIDGMSHIYRAYYAIRNLSNSKGFPTNALYGFTSMLRKLIEAEKPDYIGVAMDLAGPTVRHEKFEAYKATRKPMPEDLAQQIPYIQKICDVFHVPLLTYQGYEADDVIGTLSKKASAQGLLTMVVTSDKDMLQLVSGCINVLDTMKDSLILDEKKVVEKMGVQPRQIPDLLGLWGDSSDNIPGAPGIGEKGAKELIQAYGTLESCLQNWEKVKKKTYQESLRDNADLIRTSKELATIHTDLPIELDLSGLVLCDPDQKAAFELFSELEFKSLMKEFAGETKAEVTKAQWLTISEAGSFLESMAPEAQIFFVHSYRVGLLNRKVAEAVCVQAEVGTAALIDLRDESLAQIWAHLMENPKIKAVCWDAKLCFLAQEPSGIRMHSNVDDVMLMAFLTAPNTGDYSIERWAMDHLQISLAEEKNDTLSLLSIEGAGERLCHRLEALRKLHRILSARMDDLSLRDIYRDMELPLFPVLAEMEMTGIRVDPDKLHKMSLVMEKQLAELTGKIYGAAGFEFNINSPKQIGEVLFDKLNLPVVKKTRKTGGYSTDQAVLEELAESYEIPRLILEYRQIAKLKSTYVDSLPTLINSKTARVHTSFNQTGAATGRLSSSDPNLQNIPIRTDLGRLIRSAFVPDEGNKLISADYSQVELRVLAHLSEDEVLIDAFQRDEDIHERTAREVFSESQLENRTECRRMAKVINFGIVYGLSAFGLAQRLGIGREQAQAFIDAYFERYKGVRRWLDRTVEEARNTGSVRTLFGRIRQMPNINSKDYNIRQFAERTAMNSPIQGTAADIIKIAMIRIHDSLRKQHLTANLLLQVHDELVLEAPESELKTTLEIVQHEMENSVVLRVPLRVALNVAGNWMDMK
jgi:DNA polymerase I